MCCFLCRTKNYLLSITTGMGVYWAFLHFLLFNPDHSPVIIIPILWMRKQMQSSLVTGPSSHGPRVAKQRCEPQAQTLGPRPRSVWVWSLSAAVRLTVCQTP